MTYALVIIKLYMGSFMVMKETDYATMDQCFDRRDQIVESIGRPIVNYQVVCILRKGNASEM